MKSDANTTTDTDPVDEQRGCPTSLGHGALDQLVVVDQVMPAITQPRQLVEELLRHREISQSTVSAIWNEVSREEVRRPRDFVAIRSSGRNARGTSLGSLGRPERPDHRLLRTLETLGMKRHESLMT